MTKRREIITARLLEAVHSIPVALSVAGIDHEDTPLLAVNDAFCALTGYTRDDVIGRNCNFLQRGDAEEKELGLVREAIAGRTPATVLLTNYTKTGRRFLNLLSLAPLSPIGDDGGEYMLGRQQEISAPISLDEVEHRLDLSNNIFRQTVAAISASHEVVLETAHRQAVHIAQTIEIRSRSF